MKGLSPREWILLGIGLVGGSLASAYPATPAPRPRVVVVERTRWLAQGPVRTRVVLAVAGPVTAAQVAQALHEAGVVKSVRAFLAAGGAQATRLQPGVYRVEPGERVEQLWRELTRLP